MDTLIYTLVRIFNVSDMSETFYRCFIGAILASGRHPSEREFFVNLISLMKNEDEDEKMLTLLLAAMISYKAESMERSPLFVLWFSKATKYSHGKLKYQENDTDTYHNLTWLIHMSKLMIDKDQLEALELPEI